MLPKPSFTIGNSGHFISFTGREAEIYCIIQPCDLFQLFCELTKYSPTNYLITFNFCQGGRCVGLLCVTLVTRVVTSSARQRIPHLHISHSPPHPPATPPATLAAVTCDTVPLGHTDCTVT